MADQYNVRVSEKWYDLLDRYTKSEVDALIAQVGTYGSFRVEAGSTAETTTDATPRQIAAWNTNGLSNNVTVDHTDDALKATVAGTYEVTGELSFSGSASKTFQVEVYVYDDSATSWSASGSAQDRKLGAGGDVGSMPISAIVALDVDDKVGLYHSSSDGGTSFTVSEATMSIKRIAD